MYYDIEKMRSDDPISVTVLEKEMATSVTNGTLVEIEGVHLRSLDQAAIIRYIERRCRNMSRGHKDGLGVFHGFNSQKWLHGLR